jgi:hypothetical protein
MPRNNFNNFFNKIEKSLSKHLDFVKSYQTYVNNNEQDIQEPKDTNDCYPDFIFLPLIDRKAFAETIKKVDDKLKTRKHPLPYNEKAEIYLNVYEYHKLKEHNLFKSVNLNKEKSECVK